MDGKGRCKDNIWIERFWRTIKQEYVYLNPAESVEELLPCMRYGVAASANFQNFPVFPRITFIYGLSCVNLPKILFYFGIIA